jgi:hypothetical protein
MHRVRNLNPKEHKNHMKAISSAIVLFSSVHLFHAIPKFGDYYQPFVCVTSILMGAVALISWGVTMIRSSDDR